MENPVYGSPDPIAAIATPLAESALALIRTAGGGLSRESKSVIELLCRVFSRPQKLLESPPNSIIHGWIIDPESGEKIDEVMVSVYRAPRSYTGEDCVDISCHGGIAAVKGIMAALKQAGFREALGGEFTFRAFMNGKLDLTRAESVMELVGAKTDRGREQAVRRLAGFLHREISEIKTMLVEVLAGIEIFLDYSEDEFQVADEDEVAGRLPSRDLAEKAAAKLKALAENWRRERIYADGALAVITGKPNAGKSSLFNYLVREDRSIVTETPGTTRDWIEALISIDNIPVRLADTAGIRELSEDPENNIDAEKIGIKRSLELLDKADIVLYVINGAEGITAEDMDFLSRQKKENPGKSVLVLWNKADLALPPSTAETNTSEKGLREEFYHQLLPLSAKTGEGISALSRSITGLLTSGETSFNGTNSRQAETTAPGTLRQKELLDTALSAVEEALALTASENVELAPIELAPLGRSLVENASVGQTSIEQVPLDVVAPLFRSAVNALGEITGEVSTANILDIMFSKFCVGK